MTISTDRISFSYDRDLPILEKISFSIKKGEFVGIFGPNGGGKTTLLKILLGLVQPDTGKVEVLGSSPEKVSHRLGYVPQIRRFDKTFPITVFEVVLQGCLSKHRGIGFFSKELKNKAYGALEKVGMAQMASQSFGTLSGGQIQRTLIARALAADPEILFLDEATVGIDPKGLSEIIGLLLSLRGTITILMVTHELETIASEMNRLLCINKDATVYQPSEVCGHFAMGLYHPKTKKEGSDD